MIDYGISEIITIVSNKCSEWLVSDNSNELFFVDPLEHCEISAHYGATHAAAAWIIYGMIKDEDSLIEKGILLLNSILNRWDDIKLSNDFHNDFNNFALCVIDQYICANEGYSEIRNRIKNTVINTVDSAHDTVNWLPMRYFVNKKKYEWTSNEKYLSVCNACLQKIKTATYKDGFIDDRLPLGTSFNLQYDVATVAVLQFLRSSGEKIDIGKELGALLSVVAPDGDINYLGRGTNQIFAWGLWIYLLASSQHITELQVALNYLQSKIQHMLNNNNLLLNSWNGKEKLYWWDYHYCSVYTAHFFFWLVLAEAHNQKYPITTINSNLGNSGVVVYRNENAFVTTFDGRTEYLAEKGPGVVALWTKRDGLLVKGMFGPWQGAFGNKYYSPEITLRNYFGLLQIECNRDINKNRIMRFISQKLKLKGECTEKIKPIFVSTKVTLRKNEIEITWICPDNMDVMMNLPLARECESFKLTVDNKQVQIDCNLRIRNQYDWVNIWQSKPTHGRVWKLTFITSE